MATTYSFNSKAMIRDAKRGLAKGVTEVGIQLQETLYKLLQLPGSGDWAKSAKYRVTKGKYIGRLRKRRSRGYRRSIPGEPPAKQTGNLLRSWTTRLARPQELRGAIVLRVSNDFVAAPYARALEYGHTYATHTLEPRPYLGPATEAVSVTAEDTIRMFLATALEPYGLGTTGLRVGLKAGAS